MALSNSQYDQLMRTYELRQLDNEHRLRRHYENAYALIPELKELDEHVSSLSIAQAKNLLEGDDSALGQLRIVPFICKEKGIAACGRLAGGLPGAAVRLRGLPGYRVYRRQEMPLPAKSDYRHAVYAV